MLTRNAIVRKNNKINNIKINNNKTNDKINNNKTNDKINNNKRNNKINISNNKINNNKTDEAYLDKINEFNKIYSITDNFILNNPKIEFRYFCYKYIDYIQPIKLSEVPIESIYEAVLIEFRMFPHLEFIIRNNILKLGSDWSYTIVCGNLNYDFMSKMCSSISKNIKIIQLNYDIVTPFTYSELLTSIDFWNLFKGEKILIHQEDSIIFKDNIKDFIQWDYIGAPWSIKSTINYNNVENGGFSLRTKQCMIDIINKNSKLVIHPEDVFFTKNMIKMEIGNIANYDTASLFSSENVFNPDSFGGHRFWISNKMWKTYLLENIDNFFIKNNFEIISFGNTNLQENIIMNSKIHIDINIPFYTYNCKHRFNLTEIIFKHYINIKNKFENKALFTFTLIGSEKEISKNLALRYFNSSNDIYYEFDQGKNNNLLNMLTNKFRMSFKLSFDKKPNISLLVGSNDFISFEFFNQVINSYNNNERQIFGINNFNYQNVVLMFKNYEKINLNDDYFVWNGKYSNMTNNYCGGCIGFNDNLFKNEYDKLLNSIISFDECNIEFETLKLDNISKFISKNVFYFNIKTSTFKEINTYGNLFKQLKHNILDNLIVKKNIEIINTITNYNLLLKSL